MAPTSATAEKRPDTRIRLVESAAALFSRQGYAATGVKTVLAAADAPYGSLYHFFPGGKEQLGAAALEHGGARQKMRLESVYQPGDDVVECTANSFVVAADGLVATDYQDACPIATIALEVSGADGEMRAAAAAAFESWLDVLQDRFSSAGMDDERAREVAVVVFCLMEGAMLLARTTRSTAPFETAGRAATSAVADALAASRATTSAAS